MDNFILLVFVSFIIIFLFFDIFVNMCDKKKEPFVDNYYYWNWNDPLMLTTINSIDPNCSHCKYSMSCDLTDDAQPFCYKSYDYPTKLNNNTYQGHYY